MFENVAARPRRTVRIHKTTLLFLIVYLQLFLSEFAYCNNDVTLIAAATAANVTANPSSYSKNVAGDPNRKNLEPLSKHDFYSRLISQQHLYVDKTLMIKNYLQHNSSSVLLIRRPRKWGKSMNLEMLKRFLEIELDATTGNPLAEDKRVNKKLFVGGRVQLEDSNKTVRIKPSYLSKLGYTMSFQGTFPVIYLDFEQISSNGVYNEIEYLVKNKIDYLYRDQHRYLRRYLDKNARILNEDDKRKLDVYMNEDYGAEELKESLRFLSKILHLHYRRKVHVLIDNFDAPIIRLFFNLTEKYRKQTKDQSEESTIFGKVYESLDFQRTIDLLGEILGRCLQRNNDAVEKSMITGILRLADGGDIFANYTDIRDYTVLDEEFARYYGFTQDEADDMIYEMTLLESRDEIREWYGGYQYGGCGKHDSLYNPWSLIQYMEYNGRFSNYWINQGHMGIVEHALAWNEVKEKFQDLADGKTVKATVGKSVTLNDGIFDDIFGILLFTGYLTMDNLTRLSDFNYSCELSVPNKEVRNMFVEKFKN